MIKYFNRLTALKKGYIFISYVYVPTYFHLLVHPVHQPPGQLWFLKQDTQTDVTDGRTHLGPGTVDHGLAHVEHMAQGADVVALPQADGLRQDLQLQLLTLPHLLALGLRRTGEWDSDSRSHSSLIVTYTLQYSGMLVPQVARGSKWVQNKTKNIDIHKDCIHVKTAYTHVRP